MNLFNTNRKKNLTSEDVSVEASAVTEAQFVQLGAQDLDGNIAGSSTEKS